jgi:hypothetical protein
MDEASMLEQWHDFYVMLGGASAALVGLLFVGLSLHLAAVVARPELRALTRQAFTSFLTILIVAAFVLIPRQELAALGLELLLLAAANLALLAPRLWIVLAHRRAPDFGDAAGRFGLATGSYLALALAGASARAGPGDALYWLVAVVLVLLVTAARNAWDLLVEVVEEKAATPGNGRAARAPSPTEETPVGAGRAEIVAGYRGS